MTPSPLHPDHLQPGHMVGPWRIVQTLGRGGSARVFKVERDGLFYAMKASLRPLLGTQDKLPLKEHLGETSVRRRLSREAATLFTYHSHPNLLRIHAVDCWPNPNTGYPFLITDYVDGGTWHQWRWRKPPHSAQLVDTFGEVVKALGTLHSRGVYHRDVKAENILVRSADGRPFLIDFGTVRLPGALTQTMGIPEGSLHLIPPELLTYTRTEAWTQGVPFEGGVAADLYALGILLYQTLTDSSPFNPQLPDEVLVAAIAGGSPASPYLVNPLAPRSLSDIAMKLLEKQPEDRYPDTAALLEALNAAAEAERQSPAWQVPLTLAEDALAPRPGSNEAPQAPLPEEPPSEEEFLHERPPFPPERVPRLTRWHLLLLAVLLLGIIGLMSWQAALLSPPTAPDASDPSQKGLPSMPLPSQDSAVPLGGSRSRLIMLWMCAATGLGCPAAQVLPARERCNPVAEHNTFEVLGLNESSVVVLHADVRQSIPPNGEDSIFRDGPIVSEVLEAMPPRIPPGTMLHGRLWTRPHMNDTELTEAMVRYTQAVLPDGQKLSICLIMGSNMGGARARPGPKPGEISLPPRWTAMPLRIWPALGPPPIAW